MRKGAVIVWLSLLFLGIGILFWHNEWKYNLPTPVPANYKAISPGSAIELIEKLPFKKNKPLFLHFFNPDCPCSRFNISHVKSLVHQYGGEVTFAIVLMSNQRHTVSEIQEKFGLHIPVLFDSSLAVTCGVYSTPQAVIIGADHKLFYRGNYNRSRYCTDKKSEYARMALEGLLHNNSSILFDQFALKAYGCQLPTCTK